MRRRAITATVVLGLTAGLLSTTAGTAVAGGTGATASVSTAVAPGGTYVPLTPTRVLDTRTGLGAPRGATTLVVLQVTGVAGVPASGVGAVVLNTTVTQPTTAGYVVVSPDGSDSSNVNYAAGQDVAQLVTSQVGADGSVRIASFATTHLVADVVGYFTDPAHADAGATYRPTTPRRLLDTRLAGPGGRLAGGSSRRIAPDSVPAGATAAVVNLTTVQPDARVFVTAWASGPEPATSNMNVAPGDIRSNRAIVPLAADGSFTVASSTGHTDLVVDLAGWFTGGDAATGGAYFVPVRPTRIRDTRGDYWGQPPFEVAGHGLVPLTSALTPPVAAWLNVTVVSHLRVGWSAFDPTPGPGEPAAIAGASDVNWGPGATPNATIVALGSSGAVTPRSVDHPVGASDDLVASLLVDVDGFFVRTPARPSPGLWQQGDNTYFDTPTSSDWNHRVAGVTGDVRQLASGVNEFAVLRADGTVLLSAGVPTAPTVLTGDAVQVAASKDGVYVVKTDGTVWTDDPNDGMHGVPGYSSVFGPVTGISDAVSVVAGERKAEAVLRDGTLVAWGSQSSPATVHPVTASLGPVSTVALVPDGYGSRRLCTAYRNGRFEMTPLDGSSRVLPDLGAVAVVAVESDTCFALDATGRVHRLTAVDDAAGLTIDDQVVTGVPAGAELASVDGIRAMAFAGSMVTRLRLLGRDGTVWDLDDVGVYDNITNGLADDVWRHLDELDGASHIAGGWGLLTFVPPAG